MNLTHDLSFLKDVSKNDRKLISGGASVSGSFTGEGSSSSFTFSSSFSSLSVDGVYTGNGRTVSETKINGIVTESEDKSFNFGPSREPFSFSFKNRTK
jgi:hypothetical protein